MAEKIFSYDQRRTKEANLVIPLDEVRTYDHGFSSVTSGHFTTLYTIASGKEAYLKQIIATDTLGTGGTLKIGKVVSGGYSQIATISVLSGEATKVVDTCIGPITSGIVVMSGSPFGGDVTTVVQIDPKAVE